MSQSTFTRAMNSNSFTRPADTTAYVSGDLVANSVTAGSVSPLGFVAARGGVGTGMIRRVGLLKSGTGVTNASFRVHWFNAAPFVTNGDNGALTGNLLSSYLGAFDVIIDRAFADGAAGFGTPIIGSEISFELNDASNILYALIEARADYTPGSAEVFTLRPEFFLD